MQHGFHKFLIGLVAAAFFLPATSQANIDLKSAGNFGVLAATTITSTGFSVVYNGDVGLQPGSSITGFPPAIVLGEMHIGDAVAQAGQADLASAYAATLLLLPSQDLSGQNLGGLTLTPGVYSFSSSAALAGNLVLDGLGDANAQFVFQIGSTLTTGSFSSISVINNGGQPGSNVFWQVGSSATLGNNSSFSGNILADTSITLNDSAAIIYGSALALNGAVTLENNSISRAVAIASPVPEPATMSLFLSGSLLIFAKKFRRRRSNATAVAA